MARPRESDRRPLLDLGLGYWRSKAFLTACNLKLFTLVSQGFDTVEKVCVSEGLSQRGTRILMDAMASLRLLKKQGHGYRVASEVTGLLVEGSPEYLGDFFTAVDSMFFSPFGRFEEAVRTGKAVWNVDEAGRHIPISPEEGRLLARAMYGLSLPAARALSASHDLSGRSHLLDIGGGAGAMAIEMASKNPGLKATVLDRPTVCEVSRKYIDKAGLSSRVAAKDSDFFRDPLPAGADVHLYI